MLYLKGLTLRFYLILIITGVLGFAASGCDRLSVKQAVAGEDKEWELTDQNGETIQFPNRYLGKVMLVGYVYTHCPDICPMITYNMRDIQRELPDEQDFMLVSISFDPERDSPEILNEYATNYKLDQENWRFLTGKTNVVDDLLEVLDIQTLKTPTQFTDSGKPQYFIDHSDRVTLIDRNGNIRNTYVGSEMDQEQIVSDIHKLLTEG
ncbi:MAG: SCO family protein [Balneolaceae bacterium]